MTLRDDGAVCSRVPGRDYDLSRRSYDLLDPAGRALFVVDAADVPGRPPLAWPVVGNFPGERGIPFSLEQDGQVLKVSNASHGIRTTIEISLPGPDDGGGALDDHGREPVGPAATDQGRAVPGMGPQPARRPTGGTLSTTGCSPRWSMSSRLHAVLAWDKHAKAMGFLASDRAPEGFLTSRLDFIGRARSLWTPRVLETLAFSAARDTRRTPDLRPHRQPAPRHDAARARVVAASSADRSRQGQARGDRPDRASPRHPELRNLSRRSGRKASSTRSGMARSRRGRRSLTTSSPRTAGGCWSTRRSLRGPTTTRCPTRSGHAVVVTNRGLHTTSSVNSQQNRLTPDWSDTVTREVPAEAFYLYDPDTSEWFSPTYHPLNDARRLA